MQSSQPMVKTVSTRPSNSAWSPKPGEKKLQQKTGNFCEKERKSNSVNVDAVSTFSKAELQLSSLCTHLSDREDYSRIGSRTARGAVRSLKHLEPVLMRKR